VRFSFTGSKQEKSRKPCSPAHRLLRAAGMLHPAASMQE
jgi:hypothetical protein